MPHHIGEGKLVVDARKGGCALQLAFAVESTGKSYPEITPHTFAFNTAEGMCPDCLGLGYPIWRQPHATTRDHGSIGHWH